MRCLSVALKLVASAVPMTAVAFVSCGPASAHAHRYSYRHAHGVHYAGRHLYSYANNNFTFAGSFSSQYFGSPNATAQSSLGNGYARSGSFDNVSATAASQAGAAGLPASLVERVIRR